MIRQVSIFMENHEGRLNKLLKILAENDINIRSLNIAETMDYGIVRLILQETEKGIEVLKKNNIRCTSTSVLAAEVPDEPGGLSNLVDALTQAKINIVYAYSFLPKKTDNAIIIVRVDDEVQQKAIETLEKTQGVKLLDAETLLMK
ncbi:ACT domain-containing protein [Acetobacterium fimetarium]|uniref:ACT domain-containing protein n=1 Tax=Acetobacterium fimetarium TaxID=52691 RepID=A0ABR6WXI2_9FIRM|nr:ACT domain-containing protein [Acetobacterium fimetarium]MBC3805075.1 ACT domain-containing protein [Acetobacterium fimetarium]